MSRHARHALRRARTTGDHSGVHIGSFLHLDRRMLALTAAALAVAVLGIHDTPAQAVAAEQPRAAAKTVQRDDFVVPAVAEHESDQRDAYGVTHLDLVMWPIDPSSPISSPFGHRTAPCATCSTAHQGVDWTPGLGTPVVAIADGTVTEADFAGELGQHVKIRVIAGGDVVESVYGHLLAGSSTMHVGDTVKRGQIVGLVGDTGESTGPHLHFGILRNNVAIDPIAWMRAHVNS